MDEVQKILDDATRKLERLPGVVGVVLGGSRAKGTHRPDSDIDIGIY
nr:DNA polymerase subunit beta [Xanthomonadaceae bacterium]